MDNANAGHLGFVPQDSSEPFRMDVEARTGPPDPMAAATRYLGGWFVDLGHPDGEPPPLAGTGVVVCLMG